MLAAKDHGTGEKLWYFADHLGTVRDVGQYDLIDIVNSIPIYETVIVNHLVYDSFGKIESQSNGAYEPVYAFTGREWDADAGLYYYRARWYDAGVGRFVSEDWIHDDVNSYRYVRNSPTNATDPTGLFVDWLFDFLDRQVAPDPPQRPPRPNPRPQREANDLLDDLDQRKNGPLRARDGGELGHRKQKGEIFAGEVKAAAQHVNAEAGEAVIDLLEAQSKIGGAIGRRLAGEPWPADLPQRVAHDLSGLDEFGSDGPCTPPVSQEERRAYEDAQRHMCHRAPKTSHHWALENRPF